MLNFIVWWVPQCPSRSSVIFQSWPWFLISWTSSLTYEAETFFTDLRWFFQGISYLPMCPLLLSFIRAYTYLPGINIRFRSSKFPRSHLLKKLASHLPPFISQVTKQILSEKLHDNIGPCHIVSAKHTCAKTPILSQSLFAASSVENWNMHILSPLVLAEL